MAGDVGKGDSTTAELRRDLKIWEKAFINVNGVPASRADIKKDATISAKYKAYDRLTRRQTKQARTPQKKRSRESDEEVLKERPANVVSRTPKRQKEDTKALQQLDLFQEVEEGPTPAIVRCALGPTPQKDGEILGLFDMLSGDTPSKGGNVSEETHIEALSATPSKPTTLPSSPPNFSRTPQSSAKRKFLEAFAGTPLRRDRHDEARGTPSTARRQFATPAFLRRSFTLSRIDEEGDEVAAAAPPPKKRGIVRSLSTIIQNLKKQEDERMEDDWDIMNEIEAEERGEPKQAVVPKVLVEDSHAVEMPLGPDQGVGSGNDASDHDAGALDAYGKPRKVWKKKGLKRQTKRVIMRPVLQKPKKSSTRSELDSAEVETEVVSETQLPEAEPSHCADEVDDASVLADEDSDHRHDSHQSSQKSGAQTSKKARGAKTKAGASHEQITEDSDTRKKKKKVNAQAHANFRKLKIKNKNSKAKGRGGRFGRR